MKCRRCTKTLEDTLVYVIGHNHGFCIDCIWEVVQETATTDDQTQLADHE